jgi:hypothetical protein
MSTIYDNSALNIAASDTASSNPNPTDGLSSTRDPITIKPCHIKSPISTETHNHVRAPQARDATLLPQLDLPRTLPRPAHAVLLQHTALMKITIAVVIYAQHRID